jgi:hypothetical protein
MNYFSFILLAFSLTLLIPGCSEKEQSGQQEPAPILQGLPSNSVAGLMWNIPGAWQAERQRPMRVATYSVPASEGDDDMGEVAIFYFGPGEGGSIEANVERWFGQFEQPDGRQTREVAQRESLQFNNIPVTIVRTTGSYTAAAGPMAPRQDIRPGYKLIGAIAEGPEGAVFFKFTGHVATVQEAEPDFLQMVESVRRQ